MATDPRTALSRILPAVVVVAFAALPFVFTMTSTAVSLAYAASVVSFVLGLVIGERGGRPDDVERREWLEMRRMMRQEIARRAEAPVTLDDTAAGSADAVPPG